MSNKSAEFLSQSITKDSVSRYINKVEPFLVDIKAAYAMQSEAEMSLAAAEALINHNMV